MSVTDRDRHALSELERFGSESGLDVAGRHGPPVVLRFCLGVEHGDYNGTELFGVGTDRFIWLAYKANDQRPNPTLQREFPRRRRDRVHTRRAPRAESPESRDTWARFPFGVDHVLRREGID